MIRTYQGTCAFNLFFGPEHFSAEDVTIEVEYQISANALEETTVRRIDVELETLKIISPTTFSGQGTASGFVLMVDPEQELQDRLGLDDIKQLQSNIASYLNEIEPGNR